MHTTINKTVVHATLAGVLCYLASSGAQAETYRQHDAHEHGAAQLNVILEGSHLHLQLSSPAMNIVGFEHRPRDKDQEQAIQTALSTLRQGSALFVTPAAARCALDKVEVESGLLHNPQQAANKTKDEDSHADFEALYEFECKSPKDLQQLQVKLFERFPGINELSVQLLTERGQSATHLSAEQSALSLK